MEDLKSARMRADISIETMIPFECDCVPLPPALRAAMSESLQQRAALVASSSAPMSPSLPTDFARISSARSSVSAPSASVTLCELCEARAAELTKGIVSMLVHEMGQLILSDLGGYIAGRKGVEFLLTGILLGQLYERLPHSLNMVGMTTRAILAMLDPSIWNNAMKIYGPAPKCIRAAKKRTQTVGVVRF
jgi:hypothetical protein